MQLLPSILLGLLILAIGILGGTYGPSIVREVRDEILDVVSAVEQRIDSSLAKVRATFKRYVSDLHGRADDLEQELEDVKEALDKLAESATDLPDPDDDEGPKRMK